MAVSLGLVALGSLSGTERISTAAGHWSAIPPERLELVLGAPVDKKCHWRCFRPDCGFQTYPCTDEPFTCTVGDPVSATPVSASCKDGTEAQKCDLESVTIKHYSCRVKAGAKNNAECSGTRKRCPIENLKTKDDPDAPTMMVDREKATSSKCSSSPPFENYLTCF
jgi:hypothetical protein